MGHRADALLSLRTATMFAGAAPTVDSIVDPIQSLATRPRASGSEKLAASAALFRVRQGHYRVVYAVDDAQRTIEVINVGHRREVYRSAP
jgi:mRNA interferase RelE/StbE